MSESDEAYKEKIDAELDLIQEKLKNGVEDMWTTLQCTLQNTVTTFKEEDPNLR